MDETSDGSGKIAVAGLVQDGYLGEIASPQAFITLWLGGGNVIAADLRVASGSQDIGVARIRSINEHVSSCLHDGTPVTEISTGDLAQPAKVDQVKRRI